MDCAEIRDAFRHGALPSNAALQAHLAECQHCRELFEQDAEVGRSLGSQAALALPFPEPTFGPLEARLAHETGLRAWLRSRPTRLRFLLLVLSVLLAVGVGGALELRSDFGAYPTGRLVLLLGIYLIGILAALGKELSRALRRGSFIDHFGLLLAALGVPFLVALAPATEASRLLGPEGALGCFSYGALLTLPAAALLWAFDRNDQLSVRTVCLSAAALGMSANLVLELHCSNGNFRHVLLGHASLGVAWLLGWALARRLGRSAASA
jgi:hypothetical protein